MKRKLFFCLTFMLLTIIAFCAGYLTKDYLINNEGYISLPKDYNIPLYTQSDEPEIYTITPEKIPYVNEELQILDRNTVAEEFEAYEIDNITQHFYTKKADDYDINPIYTYFEMNGINYDLDMNDSTMHRSPEGLYMIKTELIVDGYPVYSIDISMGATYADCIYIIFKDVPTIIAHIANSLEKNLSGEILSISGSRGSIPSKDTIYIWKNDALYLYEFSSYLNAYCVYFDYDFNVLRVYRSFNENAVFDGHYRTDFKIEPLTKNSLELTLIEIPPTK